MLARGGWLRGHLVDTHRYVTISGQLIGSGASSGQPAALPGSGARGTEPSWPTPRCSTSATWRTGSAHPSHSRCPMQAGARSHEYGAWRGQRRGGVVAESGQVSRKADAPLLRRAVGGPDGVRRQAKASEDDGFCRSEDAILEVADGRHRTRRSRSRPSRICRRSRRRVMRTRLLADGRRRGRR